MAYAIYVLVKLAAYMAWCWLGLLVWRPAPVRWSKAFGWGVLRLGIGVLFGVVIFFAVPAQPDDVLWKYLIIYSPVRLLEWLIVAWIIRRHAENPAPKSALLWCLGGIAVSFAADFASPEGVAGHFCVGRCLC
jgi:hypothetical protein